MLSSCNAGSNCRYGSRDSTRSCVAPGAGLFLRFVLAAMAGLLFRSRRLWRIAVFLIVADLFLGATAAVLDRFGYH